MFASHSRDLKLFQTVAHISSWRRPTSSKLLNCRGLIGWISASVHWSSVRSVVLIRDFSEIHPTRLHLEDTSLYTAGVEFDLQGLSCLVTGVSSRHAVLLVTVNACSSCVDMTQVSQSWTLGYVHEPVIRYTCRNWYFLCVMKCTHTTCEFFTCSAWEWRKYAFRRTLLWLTQSHHKKSELPEDLPKTWGDRCVPIGIVAAINQCPC